MDLNKLNGSVKVAILTNAIGIEAAQPILSKLTENERQLIYKLQTKLSSVPQELVNRVAKEFVENSAGLLKLPHLPNGKAQTGAASNQNAEPKPGQRTSNIKAVQNIEPDQLLQLIKDEHPQTIALILVHLNPLTASEVLSRIPDETRADVAFRIASLDKVLSGMVEEIDRVFEEILKNKDHAATLEAGGVSRLAEILNAIDGATAEQIIDQIEENDSELADEIKQMMFVFDDIVLIDDKGLQKVLRSIESQELAIALKAATEEVKQKVFRNMSERAVEILKEEMEVSGAVRMKDVTDAQQKITRIVQEMERKGELIVSGRGGEEFIG
jgi:flagellar motor switch protein FliG